MSAFHAYNCPFSDRDSLVESLEAQEPNFRGNVEVHEVPQPLYGYHGDVRKDTAHVIVRRQNMSSASNDMGFLKGEDGKFRAIISDYDRHRFNDKWIGDLLISHNKQQAVNILRHKGFRVTQERTEGGHQKVRMERVNVSGR